MSTNAKGLSSQTPKDASTNENITQKPVKVDLSLDLVTMPVAPDKAQFYGHKVGDSYTIKGGKRKGQVAKRSNNRVALPTVKSLTDLGVKDPSQVVGKMGVELKHAVKSAFDKWDNDNRIVCTGLTHAVDSQGMARIAIGLRQTTAQKLLASLLAHGVPEKEAKAFAGKYE